MEKPEVVDKKQETQDDKMLEDPEVAVSIVDKESVKSVTEVKDPPVDESKIPVIPV